MDKPVYVIGHKNPDADSICAAIAYSALKNKLGLNTVAARLSAVNKETLYILDRFQLPVPMLLTSAKCTLAEIDMDEAMLLSKDTTMKEALDAILSRKNKGKFRHRSVSSINHQTINITFLLLRHPTSDHRQLRPAKCSGQI